MHEKLKTHQIIVLQGFAFTKNLKTISIIDTLYLYNK